MERIYDLFGARLMGIPKITSEVIAKAIAYLLRRAVNKAVFTSGRQLRQKSAVTFVDFHFTQKGHEFFMGIFKYSFPEYIEGLSTVFRLRPIKAAVFENVIYLQKKRRNLNLVLA